MSAHECAESDDIYMNDFLMPKEGTLERVMLNAMLDSKKGVSFLDFVGTGITEDNIDQVAQNLRNGMFDAENDDELRHDA